jgi:hypothetical protein
MLAACNPLCLAEMKRMYARYCCFLTSYDYLIILCCLKYFTDQIDHLNVIHLKMERVKIILLGMYVMTLSLACSLSVTRRSCVSSNFVMPFDLVYGPDSVMGLHIHH